MEADNSNSEPTEAASPLFASPTLTDPLFGHQTNPKPPLFMQRLESSGIDVSGFSFSKPVNQPKEFSLRAPHRVIPTSFESHSITTDVHAHSQPTACNNQGLTKYDDSSTLLEQAGKQCPGQPEDDVYVGLPDASMKDFSGSRKNDHPKESRTTLELGKKISSSEADLSKMPVVINLELESETSLMTKSLDGGKSMACINDCIIQIAYTNVTKATLARPSSSSSANNQKPRNKLGPQKTVPLEAPVRPKDDLRVSKRRRETRKTTPSRLHRSISNNKSGASQLTEDTLFELLIGRIRQREEDEALAASIQHQVEKQNIKLKEENSNLHKQVQISLANLQKVEQDARKRQSQMENWKEKVQKFRHVVDDLGRDYDVLRDESVQFRETTRSLKRDRNELFQAIDDIKLRISRAEGTIEEQRGLISEKESRISLLQQTLETWQQKYKSTKNEVVSEKTRTATLESYIQNYALSNAKKLTSIKEDQEKLIRDLSAGLESTAENSNNSRDLIIIEIQKVFDNALASIQALGETLSSEKLEVQNFTAIAQDMISHVSKSVQELLELTQSHMGPESMIFKQLSGCDTSSKSLSEKLHAVETVLSHSSELVQSLISTEDNLAQDLKDFNEKLVQAQIPKEEIQLQKELNAKFDENTQLQLLLQKMNFESESLQKQLDEKDSRILGLQRSLMETTEKTKIAEDHNQRLRIETTAIRGEMEVTEQRIRQEMNKEHAILKAQIESQYEERLKILQKDKDEFKMGSEELASKLSEVQGSLIKAKDFIADGQRERAILAQQTNDEMQQLRKSCTESMARLDAQTAEVQRYRESEATSCMERNDLQEQLRQSQENIHALEQRLSIAPTAREKFPVPSATPIVSFSALETQLSSEQMTPLYEDQTDFAMLFMSDDLMLSTPHRIANKPEEPPGLLKMAFRLTIR
ncbi:hypothetical protein N7462_003172 [Penicillium macrosclerotiorum]|uniref:uncharacterized protein n=1 Tax=Penicillium macrosclerotiorum TaxID=303699 RepID=UPI002546D94C|nr:uncharacterized protein N7462_003172 [Penicillium macrosclerotiorum]KAJ5688780.1 hypothetical protein N7462_003172 [Penicillium macrosclerotiorum]